MVGLEGRDSQASRMARQVYSAFKLLEKRAHAAAEGRTTIPQPDVRRQQLLAGLRPLITQSAASPEYQERLKRQLFDSEGRYTGRIAYSDAPYWYFGVDVPSGFNGVFSPLEARYIEADRMLFDATITIDQALLDPEVYTGAMGAARVERANIRRWARSYQLTHGVNVLDHLESLQGSLSEVARVRRERYIRQLARLLDEHHQGE